MYCIVFSGRLLDGYDSTTVRKAVADRLNLGAEQVERLFSGEKIVLKNGVTEESGSVYLNVLRRLGMDAGMVKVSQARKKRVETLATFKIVSWGRILDGFDRDVVMREAARRLRATREQIELLFNGTKAVLKRGVSADVGSRYVVELARIGMQIELEVETTQRSSAAAGTGLGPQANVRGRRQASGTRHESMARLGADLDEMYQGLLETQYELPAASAREQEHGTVDPAFPASSLRTVPTESLLPASGQGKTSVIRHARPAEYVRCPVCGQRQPPGTRCRACGIELARPSMVRKTIPMDASAHATPTTILGNMPAVMMRSGVAEDSASRIRSGSASSLHHLREPLPARTSQQSNLLRHACMLIGAVLVVSLVVYLTGLG